MGNGLNIKIFEFYAAVNFYWKCLLQLTEGRKSQLCHLALAEVFVCWEETVGVVSLILQQDTGPDWKAVHSLPF